jgi:hypothetical protein
VGRRNPRANNARRGLPFGGDLPATSLELRREAVAVRPALPEGQTLQLGIEHEQRLPPSDFSPEREVVARTRPSTSAATGWVAVSTSSRAASATS